MEKNTKKNLKFEGKMVPEEFDKCFSNSFLDLLFRKVFLGILGQRTHRECKKMK